MKAVFLDFDGVINNFRTPSQNFTDKYGNTKRHIGLDPALVSMIDYICKATDSVVIVHSAWRQVYDHDQLVGFLRDAGMASEIVDTVPIYPQSKYRSPFADPTVAMRGPDIREYLDQNSEKMGIESYVILDDLGKKEFHRADRGNFVQTDSFFGIKDQNAQKAISILENN